MAAIEIKPDVYWIGVNDRTSDLFEGLWPIAQEGISYNAYFINDEHKAIIDLTKSFKADEFFAQVNEISDISQLDYIIINHMEPDHTGIVNIIRKLAPRATILGTDKTVQMLASFFGITEKVEAIKDGQTLSLGKRTLQFLYTPFVHWPETMMTYETSHQILFSCDGFGGYGALRGGIFDDQCKDFDFISARPSGTMSTWWRGSAGMSSTPSISSRGCRSLSWPRRTGSSGGSNPDAS
ncbi:MAG: FprA family A-type flavoprotein [Deltaproteobacteria bacterium]|nr:FprA family A-type flavoprotein [Deltaproteobacteria bacterium]